jgi:glycosyltransferase involved in cell wall biosynthesis
MISLSDKMKILVISNYYPPYHKTGYDLGCGDIVQELIDRQHQVKVLTSVNGITSDHADNDGRVHRKLLIDDEKRLDWKAVFLKEFINQTYFKKLCADFEPEIVLFFDLSFISFSLFSLAQDMGLASCSYYANNWFITPEKDQWHKLWPKDAQGFKVLRFLTDRFDLALPQPFTPPAYSIFSSHFLKNVALDLKRTSSETSVLPLGIELDLFPYKREKTEKSHRLLYVGKIHPDKGVDDVVKALHILHHEHGYESLSLTIAGDESTSPDYAAYLRGLSEKLGLLNKVRFSGFIPQEQVLDLYHSCDILISPSHLDDSSNRTLLEAMSAGIPIVSSSTESKMEIIEDRFSGLIYPKENPSLCAEKVQCFLENHELMESTRRNARSSVERQFQIERCVDSLENILLKAGQNTKSVPSFPKILPHDRSFDDLTREAKRWLKLGKFLVFMRILMKPSFYLHLPKKIYKKILILTPHRFHSILFNIYYFANGHRRKKTDMKADKRQKILVVQLADIGDVILTSPFVRELRRSNPKAWIGLVVQPRMFPLIEKCPHVDEVIAFDWRSIKNMDAFLRGSPKWWKLSSRLSKHQLWKHRLDLAVSIRWNEDPCQAATLILMYTSGAVSRVAYKATSSDPMRYGWKDLNRLITKGPSRGFPVHEVEHQLDVLRYLGTNPSSTRLEVWTSEEDDRLVQDILEEHNI